MPSRFHEETPNALHVSYAPDTTALKALDARASKLGVQFPASFVEWYGMRGGIALLRQHSNCDEPVDIAKLDVSSDSVGGRIVKFMDENQGVCGWGIPLDAGDDPPVLVAVAPEFEWRPHADTFSTFIACQVWDYEEAAERVLLGAQASPLAPLDLDLLRRTFHEKPATHGWPGKHTFGFERDDARVRIWDEGGQADWWISARSEASVAFLARELWMCGDLKTSMYGVDERGERVLKSLRSTVVHV